MLNITYGVDTVYELIREATSKGVTDQILIVPHHFSHEAERKLSSRCGDKVSLYCEVLSLKRLAGRVFGQEGGLANSYLSEGGRLLLMSLATKAVASQLKSLVRQISKPEFLADLVALINEFKLYNVSPEALAAASSAEKLSDLALIYSAYDAMLTGSLKDPADILTSLGDKLFLTNFACNKTVYVSNFTEFTPQEMRILDALMQKAKDLTIAFNIGAATDSSDMYDDVFLGQRIAAERIRRIAVGNGIVPQFFTYIPEADNQTDELTFLAKNIFASEPDKYKGECQAVKLASADTIWSECEQVASQIKQLCSDGYMYRDIAVAATDFSSYSKILEAVFESWDIPIYTDSMDPIMEKPIMTAVVSIIDAILGGFGYEDMFRFLKTGLSGLTYDECCKLENYVLAWNIKGSKWLSGNWTMNPFEFSSSADSTASYELTVLNSLRAKVMAPIKQFLETVPQGKEQPAHVITEALYHLLVDMEIEAAVAKKERIFEQRGDLKTADEYSQLWGLICDALDTSYDVLGGTPMSFSEYAGCFKLLLGSMQVGSIPTSLDRVACGDAGRMRHRNVKCVFLVGAYSGAFPQPTVRGGILTDEDRSELIDSGLDIDLPLAKTVYRELDSAFSVLTLPKKKLYISWPLSTDKSEHSKSYLVSRIADIFSLHEAPPQGDERFTYSETPCLELAIAGSVNETKSPFAKSAYSYFASAGKYSEIFRTAGDVAQSKRDNLSPAAVEKLYGKRLKLTASRADKQRTCRFAYYMQYGLKAKPRYKAELDALESGSFLHYVLEKSLQEILSLGGYNSVTREEISAITDKYSSEYAENDFGGLEDKSARVVFLYNRLKRIARTVVSNVAEELSVSSFEPIAFELMFGGDSGIDPIIIGEGSSAVEITGIVDRIDGWMHDGKLYLRVVDYKSGYKKFDLSDVWHGLGMQMLVYLFALEEKGNAIFGEDTEGAGVLYIPINEAYCNGARGLTEEQISKSIDKALKRSGLILNNDSAIEAMEGGDSKRFIPVTVKKSGGYSAASSLAKAEEFGKLKKHVNLLLEQMGKEISQGNADANPYYRDIRSSACTYCEFSAACRFDETNGRDSFRYLSKVTGDDFWTKVEEETNGNQANT